jgi:tRNA U34 5-methylaminomethyl-2-thiouridine-forming methyltransferase MnmC
LGKFISPSGLADRLRRGPVRLLDVGFGLGMNALAALSVARETAAHPLWIDSLEAEHEALARALLCQPEPEQARLRALAERGVWEEACGGIRLHLGDLRQTLPTLSGSYDLIFQDPFSPLKNTEAWTVEVFALQRALLAPSGLWLSYAEARAVRAGLREAGWRVGASPAVPPHRGGTVAALDERLIPCPLEDPGAVAYHDPSLSDNAKVIRARREGAVRERKRC